ncbi:hypothetical protein SUGI_0254530 [Cryptomeria japonica]|nr:hypothetical protein SUGI_0254530 [Cryptomeria japonica]
MGTLKDLLGPLVMNYISPSRCWLRLIEGLGDNTHWGHLVGELQSLLEEVRIPQFPHVDKFVWVMNPSGSFSVKSAYNLLFALVNDCYS